MKNGVEYDINGKAVYGVYVSGQKKLYFNAKVYKDEEEAIIYMLHEMKHALDDNEKSIGFDSKTSNIGVGGNEGATQRFATDMAEAILNIQIPETLHNSLGIQINTNLDEYQIEDKLNELFCKAIGVSRADFLQAQNEESKEAFNRMIEKFNRYASYEDFRKALDGIYNIQEETWVDENGNLLEDEAKPTQEQTDRAKALIKICETQNVQYIQMTDIKKLEELKEDFIMPMNEYGEIVRNDNDLQNRSINQIIDESMDAKEMLYQEDYLKYQEFLTNGLDLGNNELVFISGLGGFPFDTIFEGETTMKELLKDSSKPFTEKIYVRSDDTYKVAEISFDINGTIKIGNFGNVESLDDIVEDIEHSEVIGNAPEYVRILELQGKDEKAQKIQAKYEYYQQNKSRIDEIKKIRNQKNNQASEIEMLAKQMYSGDTDGITAKDQIDNFDFDGPSFGEVERTGVVILKEDLQEISEDPQSIESRRKVLDDLNRAQSNDLEQENQNEQGE